MSCHRDPQAGGENDPDDEGPQSIRIVWICRLGGAARIRIGEDQRLEGEIFQSCRRTVTGQATETYFCSERTWRVPGEKMCMSVRLGL